MSSAAVPFLNQSLSSKLQGFPLHMFQIYYILPPQILALNTFVPTSNSKELPLESATHILPTPTASQLFLWLISSTWLKMTNE